MAQECILEYNKGNFLSIKRAVKISSGKRLREREREKI